MGWVWRGGGQGGAGLGQRGGHAAQEAGAKRQAHRRWVAATEAGRRDFIGAGQTCVLPPREWSDAAGCRCRSGTEHWQHGPLAPDSRRMQGTQSARELCSAANRCAGPGCAGGEGGAAGQAGPLCSRCLASTQACRHLRTGANRVRRVHAGLRRSAGGAEAAGRYRQAAAGAACSARQRGWLAAHGGNACRWPATRWCLERTTGPGRDPERSGLA